jgi:hypothetical protein
MIVIATMTQDVFKKVPYNLRIDFKNVKFVEVDEYNNNKHDKVFLKLYEKQKKAKKDLEIYLFEKRHGKKI